MGELISGENVVLALLKGRKLLWRKPDWDMNECESVCMSMWSMSDLINGETASGEAVEFYLTPMLFNINGVDVEQPKKILIDSITGSVGLVYDDIQKAEKYRDALKSIFNIN